MVTLNLVFACVVGGLAALATVGTLVLAVVWEWYALRRVIERNRRPAAVDPARDGPAASTAPELRPPAP